MRDSRAVFLRGGSADVEAPLRRIEALRDAISAFVRDREDLSGERAGDDGDGEREGSSGSGTGIWVLGSGGGLRMAGREWDALRERERDRERFRDGSDDSGCTELLTFFSFSVFA